MEIDEMYKKALANIDFFPRYENLSNQHKRDWNNDPPVKISSAQMIELLGSLGHKAKYIKKENFYELEEEIIGHFSFGFHICFKYERTELIWLVYNEKGASFGGPWTLFSRLLINPDYIIKYPVFRSIDELKEILVGVFDIYEDFKKEVIRLSESV